MTTKTIKPADYGFQVYEAFSMCFNHPKTGKVVCVDFEVNGQDASCSIDEDLADVLFDGEKLKFQPRQIHKSLTLFACLLCFLSC